MGNAPCFGDKGRAGNVNVERTVFSRGIQCELLSPTVCCTHVCSSQKRSVCGDVPKVEENFPKISTKPHLTLKSKIIRKSANHENNDALVSLSETVSESSMEDFLNRKRMYQKEKQIKENQFATVSDDKTLKDLKTTLFNIDLSEESAKDDGHKKSKKNRRKHRGKKKSTPNSNSNDTSSEAILSSPNSELQKKDLNNSADILSNEDSQKSTETLCSPKKSILKNTEKVINEGDSENNEESRENVVSWDSVEKSKRVVTKSFTVPSNDFSTHTLYNRSISAMSNHDSLDQLMSFLKSNTNVKESSQSKPKKSQSNECLNKFNNTKCVNFASDIRSPQKSTYKTVDDSELSDGRIKKRFILRETHKLFEILNDPNDRRIRSICDRHQCDLEIFVRPPKIGLMYFAVEIVASNKYSLRMCVRELDSSMKWCISSQLF